MSITETGPLTVIRHQAMATDFEISLNEKGSDAWAGAALDAFDEVDRLEELLSVFRATSPVSRLNLLAAEMNVKTDRELIDYIKLSQQISRETEGAFDITTTPLWEIWGFSRRQGEVPSDQQIQEALSRVGMNYIRIQEEESTIAFDRPGVSINFGGIGKGIAMDRAVALLMDRGVPDFLIHGGKSSIVAHGGRAGDTFWKKEKNSADSHEYPCWTIGLGHPLQPNKRLAEIHLSNIALATSGSQYQFFRYKGERLAHILNPRTGQPVRGTLAVTVLAPDAATADALSTAFFVLGPEKTEAFCSVHPEISVIYCLETRKSPGFNILYFNVSKEIISFY